MTRPLLLALLLAAAATPAAAQTPAPPPLLLLPGSTRAMGLGNAYVAGSGADAIFYNPAQVGVSRNTVIATQRFGSRASLASVATNTAALGLSIGVAAQYLEYGATREDGGTSIGALARGGDFAASSVLGLLSAAIDRNGIRMGITAKYLAQQVAIGRQSTPSLDFGAARDIGRLTVGLALTDPDGLFDNTSTPRLRLPTRATLGAMLANRPIGTWFDAGIAASVSTDSRGRLLGGGGVEVSYLPVSGWSFTGRAGLQAEAKPEYRGVSPLTLGASITADRLTLDYAFQQLRGAGAAHRVGVRVR